MSLQPEQLSPMQVNAFRDVLVNNGTVANPNGISYLGERISQEFSPIHLYSQSIYTGNQPKQEIARVYSEDIVDRQFRYLAANNSTLSLTDSNGFVEYFLAGLLKKEQGDYRRVELTREMLQQSVRTKNRKQLLAIYASKCGDFTRAFFDSTPPNAKIATDIIEEAQTLAVIQMLIEGNQEVSNAVANGGITVNDFKKKGVCSDFSSAGRLEETWRQRTIELLKQNLHLINATSAISQADADLARDVFADGGAVAHTPQSPFATALQQIDSKFVQRHDRLYVYDRLADDQLAKIQADFGKISKIFA